MYDYIHGKLIKKDSAEAVLDVNGVGFLLKISRSTFEKLPEIGNDITLNTYLHVREDALQLFGFISEEERSVYIKLLSTSGIGPKLALTILSGLSPEKVVAAIKNRDELALNSISGVGKKTAQRLIVELKDKFKDFETSDESGKEERKDSLNSMESETIMALISLGYSKMQAEKAVKKPADGVTSVEQLIKHALKVI
jgi:Holliday junction DNA helicase RuvA